MLSSESLYLKLIYTGPPWQLKDFVQELSLEYDEVEGFGFIRTNVQDNIINSTLVYVVDVPRDIFDPESNTLTRRREPIHEHVPFSLDYREGTLEVYYGGRRLTKLLKYLRRVLGEQAVIENIEVDMVRFMAQVANAQFTYQVLGVTVTNYSPELGLSGRFRAKVSEQDYVLDLIKDYADDVAEVQLKIFSGDVVSTWRVTAAGRIAIRTDDSLLEYQKELAVKMMLRAQRP